MDGVTGLSRILGSNRVNERNPGSKQQQADAFRKAMQERKDGANAESKPPMRRGLQPSGPDGRKQDGEVHHVDVVA